MKKLKRVIVDEYEKLLQLQKRVSQWISVKTKYRLQIMSPLKTIKYIQQTKCSVARFGDGEFVLMMNEGISFQEASIQLADELKNVLRNSQEQNNLLICIPRYFNTTCGTKKEVKAYWKKWGYINNRQINIVQLIQDNHGKGKKYGDALITRPYMDMKSSCLARKLYPELKKIWNEADVLIVEGKKTRLGVKNDLFANAKNVRRIIAPSENAFRQYNEILSAVLNWYKGEIVLIALGPTATVLASELSKKGIWAIDVGHLDIEYEWYIRNSTEKIAIPEKYTNEVENGNIVASCDNKKYLSEIIEDLEANCEN